MHLWPCSHSKKHDTIFIQLDAHALIHAHLSFYIVITNVLHLPLFAWVIMDETGVFSEYGSPTSKTNLVYQSNPILTQFLRLLCGSSMNI